MSIISVDEFKSPPFHYVFQLVDLFYFWYKHLLHIMILNNHIGLLLFFVFLFVFFLMKINGKHAVQSSGIYFTYDFFFSCFCSVE